MQEQEYQNMLVDIIKAFPTVFVHYPEMLHKISIASGVAPERACSWVYNSNTAKQHRDIAYYKINPVFTNAYQPYKNPNDKRIKERIAKGKLGGANV